MIDTVVEKFDGFHHLRVLAGQTGKSYKAILAEGLKEIEGRKGKEDGTRLETLESAFRIELTCMTR